MNEIISLDTGNAGLLAGNGRKPPISW